MKKYFVPILLLVVLFVLTACTEGTSEQPSKSNNNDSTTNSSSNNEESKKDSIVIGFEADAGTLIANTDVNYATDAQIRNIYDPLITRDSQTGKYIPFLAESWESIDELTWRLTLKEGVKFHNGADFNAESVKFSIDYILDENNGSFYRSRWANISEVVVLSPTEVEIRTSVPFPGLIERITGDLLILEPGYVAQVGNDEAAKKPVGTGPYQFVEWSRDNYLKLEAFEEYWNGAPSIKQVEFRYIPEFSSRLSAFLSGEIDLFKNIPVDSVQSVEADANSKIEEVSSSRINYLALNTHYEGPLQDEKVRLAINYAVDVDELISAILNGHATKMTGPLSKINSNYTETTDYSYDADKAIALLKEAGYAPEDITLTLDTPNGRYPMDAQVAQAIAAQLQRIGIKVNVQVNEWGTHLEKIRNREMKDMYILGWGPAFEPDSTIFDLFTQNAPYSSFYDEAIEQEIVAATKIFDNAERKEAYNHIQHLLVDTAAWVPLWQQGDLYAVRANLKFEPRVDEEIKVFEMSWE
ncbi:ABC transporter substrate-binding protein [Metasolibacillus sp.]|uniref:ABC transporter substrate-binding protein n=1 Tax=Metasolibacillus sp. TaxID=2703680 RepID=UPI0025FFB487|nr:ABC transporter substrate-binding protein [Metasolibacillus sp.]MCT6923061.1 ABC transporter substrate-binding protein [Metasolibacillus sp.]MCT6939299.1 ABC transporter substrate-binding protein [Metasolibacillus sp.]